jgi:tetratricopeptide (TPR) repeat protein
MVGACLGLGLVLARAWRGAGRIAVVLVVLCLGVVTADRALVWVDDDTLWTTTVDRVDSPRALERSAHVLRDRGEYERALVMHDRQFRLWERLPVPENQVRLARAHRALVLAGVGRAEEALGEARAVQAVDPGLPAAQHAVAVALDRLGRSREARVEIERLLARYDDEHYRKTGATIYLHLSGVYTSEANPALATQCLRRSVDLFPLAEAEEMLRQRDEEYGKAYRELEHERSNAPWDRKVQLALAELNARHGRWREAFRGYSGLLRGETPPRPAEPVYSFARYYFEAQDTAEGYATAARLYEELLRDHPEFSRGADRDVAGRLKRCRNPR